MAYQAMAQPNKAKVITWVGVLIAVVLHIGSLPFLLMMNGYAGMMSDGCLGAGGDSFYCTWWGGMYFIVNVAIFVASYLALAWYIYKSKSMKGKLLAIALLPAANLAVLWLESQIVTEIFKGSPF